MRHRIAEAGRQTLNATVEYITPDIAADLLDRNPNNRTIRWPDVYRYARDMTNGDWRLTGEAIKIDEDGNLVDGQHRCLAVIDADIPVQMLVVRGIDLGAREVMDTGIKRRASDALHMRSYEDTNVLAATAKLAVLWRRGEIKKASQQFTGRVSNSEVISFVESNDDLPRAVKETNKWRRKITVTPTSLAFTFWATARIDSEDAFDFFTSLAEMRTQGTGDPKYTLLRRLANLKDKNERISGITESFYIFRVWNACRKGEPLANLKVGNVHGPFDFVNPV